MVGGVLVAEPGRSDVGDAAVRPAGPRPEGGAVRVVEAGAAAGDFRSPPNMDASTPHVGRVGREPAERRG